MATITIPRLYERLIEKPQCHFGVPLQSDVLRQMALGTCHLTAARHLRSSQGFIDYDTSEGPLTDSRPGGNFVARKLFRPSARARYLQVRMRYQAVEGSSFLGFPDFYADVRLYKVSDGSEQDAGFRWRDLHLSVEEGDGIIKVRYPTRWVEAPLTARPTAGESPTAPRLLNVGSNQGTLLEVVIDTENVRPLAIQISEVFEGLVEQVFTP